MRLRPFASSLIALLLAAGCEDRPPPPLPLDAGTVEPGEVAWGSCSGTRSTTCAEVELPLDWDALDGPTYPVVVRRIPGATPSRHLWILVGGPGGDADSWEPFAQRMVQADPRLTVYLFHQRGTGRSGRLACPMQESARSPGGVNVVEEEHAACIAALTLRWGDALPHISATASARDLAFLVEQVREPGEDVIVLGSSYGTYLANRYLQVAETPPTAVVMSAIVTPDVAYPDTPATFEAASREVFAACGEDAYCSARLGSDPAATFEALLTRLDEGHCSAGDGIWSRQLVQQVVSRLFYDWSARAVALALVHRLDRCSDDDRAALSRFRGLGGSSAGGPFSWVLFAHITLSEMWRDGGPTLEQAQALEANGLLGDGGLANFIQMRESWPRYDLDRHDNGFAETRVPMLMINGSLDPATPLLSAERVGAHFDAPGQTFVTIEGGAHGFGAPLEDGQSCAQAMIEAFVSDPAAPVDDCGARVVPPDFRGTPELANAAFGTADLWDEPDPGALVALPPVDVALTRHLSALLDGRLR
ncbi:MAG: alpha/beta fold hydrolase [Sandaracinaceae bacterium]